MDDDTNRVSLQEIDSERRMQLLIDSITDYAIYMLDLDGHVVSWNSGAQRFKGYTAAEIIGQHFSRFYTEEDRKAGIPQTALATALRDGRFATEGWRIRKDGKRFWASVVIDVIRDEERQIIGFAKITRDITEQMTAQAALRSSEERFRLLVQGVTDYAIYMIDPQGYVTNWNAGAQRFKGYTADEIVGQHFSRFYTDEDRATELPRRALETALREGRFEQEGWRVRKDGIRFWASVVIDPIRDEQGELIGFAKVTRDLTERKRTQEKLEQTQAALFHSQKLEAIGQLTGGVAHDFNNLLTVVTNCLDLLSRKITDGNERKLIASALRASERGAQLTQQLLAFARRQPLKPAVHNPNTLIRDFEAVLQRGAGDSLRIDFDLEAGLPAVSVDASQFTAALLNLVVNARDATLPGGTLRLTTRSVEVGAEPSTVEGVLPGSFVMISVEDNGQGMAPDVLERAFEPFFTTKEIGRGSGMGLSQVYGFVTQSGGQVVLDSTPGRGTTVRLYLPTCPPSLDAEPGRPAAPRPQRLGTVLLVEDEADVLEIGVEIAKGLGYEVLTAGDGVTALQILEREPQVDVLFSDVVMPRMNGVDLARAARRLRPDLHIVLASGYPLPALAAEHGALNEFEFINKPYRWSDLANRLRHTDR